MSTPTLKLYTIVEQLNVTLGEVTAILYVTNRQGANVAVAEYPDLATAAAAVVEFRASDARATLMRLAGRS